MLVCRRALFEGFVQGVGFRFRTALIAREFAVAGSVKNLPDGRVEIMAEGEEAEVNRFLERVRGSMARHITKVTTSDETPTHSFSNFEIRH
ncbi:MAG TPA: acylphosphatase [Planctomycetes bacterium]|nr:acylphosphatase [Planctomycetota bacterium]